MVLRFIIGRAGSGKTHHCLESIRARLRENPIDGPRLVFLVPEQASLQMERAIIGPRDLRGAHRLEVLSFDRLAFRVLSGRADQPNNALSEQARAMVLRHLVASHSRQLRYYRHADRLSGFIARLSATIGEFIEGALEPGDLADVANVDGHDDPLYKLKIHDLHLLYRAYLQHLGDDRVDPSQRLAVARRALGSCSWLRGVEVWVDGFASFSRQEIRTLVELARLSTHTDITLMMDPALCDEGGTSAERLAMGQLFARPLRTYRDLTKAIREAEIEIEPPLQLALKPLPRFVRAPSLDALERRLFMPFNGQPERDNASPRHIALVELPSLRVEVDYAVARIVDRVQRSSRPYRYRDIAIIVRDLEIYHDLLSEALEARGIPYFVDRRRPIAHHPLVELLRAMFALATEAFSLEAVRLILKTGLLSIADDEAEEFENYLIKHGIAGFAMFFGEDWSFASRRSPGGSDALRQAYHEEQRVRVNATRRKLVEFLESWSAFTGGSPPASGVEWRDAIRVALDRIGVPDRLARWSREAVEEGDMDQAQEHHQIWQDFSVFLDDFAFAFVDERLDARRVGEILEAGLAAFTIGLAPPMVDQVLVGSIDRSRHPNVKMVLLLGFNEGVFPKQIQEDSILNDDDRATLQRAGVDVGPAARERLRDEALLAYVAVTRPSEALVVTFSKSNHEGKTQRPSPYVESLLAACPNLTIESVSDPATSRGLWDIQSVADLADRLALEFRNRPRLEDDQGHIRAAWNELYDSVRGRIADDDAARLVLSALRDTRNARLSRRSVSRAVGREFRTSVSQLETYAACPFQYFARYTLRLEERAEAALAPLDVGRVHHLVLEDYVNRLAGRREAFSEFGEEEALGLLQESCARVAGGLPDDGTLLDARNAYLLSRSASQLGRVVRTQLKVSRAGTARPRATEVPFGFRQPGSLPALELRTPAGRKVRLRGYIDRVDLAELGDDLLGVVIDYKRTMDKRLDLSRTYHGLSLQLLAYLLVLREHGESLAGRPVQPAAGLYVSLLPNYLTVDHPSLLSDRDAWLSGSFRPRGLISVDHAQVLDQNIQESGWSPSYSLYRKQDGSFGRLDQSDAAEDGAFQAMLDHTEKKLGELADRIIEGDVSVNPYRLGTLSPCSWCAMASVCRFEMGLCDVRFLDTLKRSEILSRLTRKPNESR